MWELRHESRVIAAKLLDLGWLEAFHRGRVLVKPGDSIRAIVDIRTEYDDDHEVISTHYDIVQVLEVLSERMPEQLRLPDSNEPAS